MNKHTFYIKESYKGKKSFLFIVSSALWPVAEAGNFVKWYVLEAVYGHVTIETNQIFTRNATWGRVLYGRRETGKR